MSDEKTPVPRLVSINRQQLLLRTVDVEQLVDDGHSIRSIWELVGRLDLRLYHAQIAAVEGSAGREHTDPQLLISLWLYAYSRGVSSARELARQCEYEPGCQWLCGLQPVSHRSQRQPGCTRRPVRTGSGDVERGRIDHPGTGDVGRNED